VNRIFFRFFVLVMLSITVASFVIYFAINRLFGDPLDEIARRQAATQIFLLQQYVDQAPPDEWLARLNKVREVSRVRYDLIPLGVARAAVPPSQREALERGAMVLDPANKTLYRRVDLTGQRYIGSESDVIRATNLPIDIGLALKMEVVRYVIVAFALLVPIALWSRSHWRALQSLSRMADEFGAGRLSVRSHMKRSASVYPLAERFNHMAGRIEHLLQAQNSLLHSVSHELRTPIARLGFGLELLGEKTDDPQLHKRIAGMERDLAELNELVGELLGMARLDSEHAINRAQVALAPLLHDCVTALQPAPKELDCAVDGEVGSVEGDARLLARAVGNLLRNAVKYASGRVVLSARRTTAGPVEIVVEDDGPGIPEAEREKVFEPFYRLDRSRDRATGGFGLGLSIARKAVTLHGGAIRAGESPLGGARFVITLPLGSQ
jgi:two-component system OmpR family sensor kinase